MTIDQHEVPLLPDDLCGIIPKVGFAIDLDIRFY